MRPTIHSRPVHVPTIDIPHTEQAYQNGWRRTDGGEWRSDNVRKKV